MFFRWTSSYDDCVSWINIWKKSSAEKKKKKKTSFFFLKMYLSKEKLKMMDDEESIIWQLTDNFLKVRRISHNKKFCNKLFSLLKKMTVFFFFCTHNFVCYYMRVYLCQWKINCNQRHTLYRKQKVSYNPSCVSFCLCYYKRLKKEE